MPKYTARQILWFAVGAVGTGVLFVRPAQMDLRSHQMLRNARAISGFSVDDVAQAREFYGTTWDSMLPTPASASKVPTYRPASRSASLMG
jgi:hypothetical protein